VKAGLESGSGIANTPYRRTDWCKVKSDGWLVGFRKATMLPSRTEEDLPNHDENGPGHKAQGGGSLEANSQWSDVIVITSCLTSRDPLPLELGHYMSTASVMKTYSLFMCPVRAAYNVLPTAYP
jgi:hypothetical protein